MNPLRLTMLALPLLLSACGPRQLEPDAAIICDQCDGWNEPQQPFRIHGNTWYVGTNRLSSILIETDDGLILIDAALPQSAALIEANIQGLGFDVRDLKAILVSHAHFDHVGGVAALQRLSNATVYTSQAGREPLLAGKLFDDDPQYVEASAHVDLASGELASGELASGDFPPVRNVVAVGDGDVVSLGSVGSVGSVDVKAVYTPGHSPGGTTWTWQSCALGNCYDIVYGDSLSSVSAPGFEFSTSGVADDIIASAGIIGDLDCDIFLSPHPFFFGMHDKLERFDQGNPFVQKLACRLYADSMLGWLEQRLEAEG